MKIYTKLCLFTGLLLATTIAHADLNVHAFVSDGPEKMYFAFPGDYEQQITFISNIKCPSDQRKSVIWREDNNRVYPYAVICSKVVS
jgi:hypothetical protein